MAADVQAVSNIKTCTHSKRAPPNPGICDLPLHQLTAVCDHQQAAHYSLRPIPVYGVAVSNTIAPSHHSGASMGNAREPSTPIGLHVRLGVHNVRVTMSSSVELEPGDPVKPRPASIAKAWVLVDKS